jgi:ATP-dependent Clp protease, protease subunit
VPDIEVTAREIMTLTSTLTDIVAKHTKQPTEKIRADTQRDYYLSAEEAKDYGLVDAVIERASQQAAITDGQG